MLAAWPGGVVQRVWHGSPFPVIGVSLGAKDTAAKAVRCQCPLGAKGIHCGVTRCGLTAGLGADREGPAGQQRGDPWRGGMFWKCYLFDSCLRLFNELWRSFFLIGYLPQIPRHPFGLSPSKPGRAVYVQGFDRLSPNGWGREGV